MKDQELIHSGTPQLFPGDPHGSGRYREGSGENPYQHGNGGFLGQYYYYKESGEFKNDTEIARAMGYSTTEFRALKTNAKAEKRAADRARAIELMNRQIENSKDGTYNRSEIAREMGIRESSVRNLLNPVLNERSQITKNVADVLKKNVDSKKYIDVGEGVENQLGISQTKLRAAVNSLKDEGYHVETIYVTQLGTGKQTKLKVLVGPDCTWQELAQNKDKIRLINDYSENGGRTFLNIEPPVSVSSDRIQINYDSPKDGVIELRRGVEDISLGNANYAQVRIAVDDSHYLKGMAMYSDHMPDGIDIMFNTNKHPGTPMMSDNKDDPQVLKPLKKNKDNVFGATIKNEEDLIRAQRHYIDENGERKLSAINIVNEEGDWSNWSRNLSAQFLSKQSPALAKKQLEITSTSQADQLDEIKKLTNPVVKQKMLDSFADDCDSKAVHLKAASLPNQASHVILPFPEIRENEIYAPNYSNGETVALIRYPHGGKFEIPILTVNNKNKEARSLLPNSSDAVGINPAVAGKLSGADFDGDTVMVIPVNDKVKIQTSNHPAFKSLQTFDPKESYPGYEGMKRITPHQKQVEMGKTTNLIADMTLKGASPEELTRAVKHSMVIIDAEKHGLNWKQSEKDFGVKQLKEKYQGRSDAGASTLITRAKSESRPYDRKEITNTKIMTPEQLKAWNEGKKVYVETGKTWTDKDGKVHRRLTKSTQMMEVDDAFELATGGTVMESIYATHANKLKAMANDARKESRSIKGSIYNPEAKKVYAPQVASLDAKLNMAMKNKPLERQAQLVANKTVQTQMRSNPDMSKDEVKRLKNQALAGARYKVGKTPYTIDITEKEWSAIQAGAISKTKLSKIIDNADMDQVKKYATPRTGPVMTKAKVARAKALINAGYTQAEVAEQLGVSPTTLAKSL